MIFLLLLDSVFFGFFSFCSGPGEMPHAHPKCYAKRTGLDLSTSGLCTGFRLGPIVEELCYIRAFSLFSLSMELETFSCLVDDGWQYQV